MGQLVQLGEQARVVQHVFTANLQAMAKMVPRTMGDPSRLLRIAYNSVAYDPLLLETSKTAAGMASIVGGVMEALKLGLTIGGPMQEAFLIPFRNKGTLEATLIVGFMGYRNILDRSKSVLDLQPRAVYANDEFDVNFGTSKVFHKPYWLLGQKEPGELVAVYCIAHLQRGGIQIEVMPRAEIDEHRARSRAKDSGSWVTDYAAMALKTVIRKIAKYLPKSSEILMRALDLDMKADLGESQDFDVTGLVFDDTVPSKQVGSSRLDALKQKLPAAATQPATADATPVRTAVESSQPPAATQTPPAPQGQPPSSPKGEGGARPPIGPPSPPAASPSLMEADRRYQEPTPPSEEALRELDEALGAPAGTHVADEIGHGPILDGADVRSKEENARLDALIAADDARRADERATDNTPAIGRPSRMTPVAEAFALQSENPGAKEVQNRVDALRKRAEELANSRKRR